MAGAGRLVAVGVVAIALASVIVSTGSASAAPTTLRGYTEEGRGGHPVFLTVGVDGRVLTARFRWNAGCHPGHLREATDITFRHPTRPGAFAIKGGYRFRSHGYRFKVRLRARGHEARIPVGQIPQEISWSGVLKARAKVSRHGRLIASCRTGKITWSAKGSPPAATEAFTGTLQIASTVDNIWIPGNDNFTGQAPPGHLRAGGDSQALDIKFSDPAHGWWNLIFQAPENTVLQAGVTYQVNGNSLSTSDPGPYLSVSANGHSCDHVHGQFTVNSISLDRYNRPVSADISFVQDCGGLSGRLAFSPAG